MNVGDPDIKEIQLHGKHEAGIVYCLDLSFGNPQLGILVCDDVIGMTKEQLDALDRSTLNENDRIYYGIIKANDIQFRSKENSCAENESRADEAISDSDIYPVEE